MAEITKKAIIQEAVIEEIESGPSEIKELDQLAEETPSVVYPGKILRPNWAYELITIDSQCFDAFDLNKYP